ncbi:MAG: DUF288 domain-containing protein [Opitutales bacterium]|nr:DUF288 domain-containing protein [Opitutales bacterium]
MTDKTVAVITTIQAPTLSVQTTAKRLSKDGISLIVIGDRKGPWSYELSGTRLYSLTEQEEMPYRLARVLPTGHYARKNLGYLVAMREGASCIYETDDDNAPNSVWVKRNEIVPVQRIEKTGWCNVYSLFTSEKIWPRGLPLDKIDASLSDGVVRVCADKVQAPIQQGLANLSPDVDAVWRMVLDRDFCFDDGPSVLLPRNSWCPFNSQSTWWWPSAYPLMYLPSNCPFRMTDIWRSFIAQRCLWEFADGIVFHHAEVDQERNFHNLMRDFEDEIPGYVKNARIVDLLQSLSLKAGVEHVCDNLIACYRALVAEEVFPQEELCLVAAWLDDMNNL